MRHVARNTFLDTFLESPRKTLMLTRLDRSETLELIYGLFWRVLSGKARYRAAGRDLGAFWSEL